MDVSSCNEKPSFKMLVKMLGLPFSSKLYWALKLPVRKMFYEDFFFEVMLYLYKQIIRYYLKKGK